MAQNRNTEQEQHEEIDSCRIITDKDYNIVAIDCIPSKEQTETVVKFSELPSEYQNFGFEIDNYYFINNQFIDKRKYNSAINFMKMEQENEFNKLTANERQDTLFSLPDKDAAKIPMMYKEWKEYIGKPLKKDDRIQYDFKLWKVLQNISIVLENQPPSLATASLYTVVETGHSGTLDDPIPANKGMEYEKGKYYIDNGSIYLMNRQGMNNGDKIVLHYLPSELVGQYFEKVK